jgi:ATP-dependent helicase/nuclease subunit B
VQARFLLGPAGSGKTFRCVGEVRAELVRAPDGPPLIFLAPKQATFQLERQLLADAELSGYSRLQILSFERLAAFVFAQLGAPVPELLSEEGRVMALRALLAREHAQLKIFRSSARLTGFAAQLSLLLRELQRSRVSTTRLMELSQRVQRSGRLDDKLHDLARLLGGYEAWLASRRAAGQSLEDANRLPDLATEALRQATAAGTSLKLGALWLDGFAEMTPQEIALLAALAPHCEQMTLAFCLADEPASEPAWITPWAIVGRTYGRCREALRDWPATIEVLKRDASASRFASARELAELERALAGNASSSRREEAPSDGGGESGKVSKWAGGNPPPLTLFGNPPLPCSSTPSAPTDQSLLTLAATVRLVECPNPEAEATLAAREILRHVQAGGRFRDCAMLVRSLEGYHDVLRRVLERYQIPFFLDRRETVAHHPLAELTRFALRTVTFDWRHEDWFGVLKTGLAPVADEEVDALENEALRYGWQGRVWRETLKAKTESGKRESGNIEHRTSNIEPAADSHPLEKVRARAMPAFLEFSRALAPEANAVPGAALVAAIRGLWSELKIEQRLADWNERAAAVGLKRAAHDPVWTQMNDWLANVELAFATEALPLREWLPILEAGLAGLTVGAVPPGLDQVLVGSIDRSRNPDLQRVFVLGVNEGVFPAPPQPGPLLTEADRLELEAHGVSLSANQRLQLGHERYFGYIAFTRARRELLVTWSRADTEGRELNASPFVAAIQRALPAVTVEKSAAAPWSEAVHGHELEVPILLSRSSRRGEAPSEEDDESGKVSKCAGGNSPPLTSSGTPPLLHSSTPSAPSATVDDLAKLEEFSKLVARWEQTQAALEQQHFSPEIAAALYGKELKTSVSALEQFLGCPFQYVAARALRTEEREEFEADPRQKGSFQHAVMEEFHRRIAASGRAWRDLTPAEARQLVHYIGATLVPTFRDGLFNADDTARFTAGALLENLERLVETLIGWAAQYQFDPARVEVSFGLPEAELPAWRIELTGGRSLLLRGRIDRVDLCRTPAGEALLVICDYKSSGKKMDAAKMQHGLEIQLLAYLAALAQMPEAGVLFAADKLTPAGVFYVPLRGKVGAADTRVEAGQATANFQHLGRFDGARLVAFDARNAAKGDQFKFKVNKDGAFAKTGNEALAPGEFPALLAEIEATLRQAGEGIFSGEAAVAPYRLKGETACDWCAYRSVCRFDPWTMPFRVLKEERA